MIKLLNESTFDMDEFENKIVLLDFGAEYCTSCENLTPIIKELSEEYKNIDFYSIKADENINIAKQFRIMNLPTLILLINNEISECISGFQTKQTLKSILNKYI